jgi:acyl-CoA synthetase (AMP-forming)/AMP-acid ligase II
VPLALTHESATNFADVLPRAAAARGDSLVFRFLVDGETEGPLLTFASLERRTRGIAAALRRRAGPGERALLLYPPGLGFVESFFGCLAGGVIAVPAYPPRPERAWQGQQLVGGIARDCRPAVVLTGGESAAGIANLCRAIPELARTPWINTDLVDDAATAGDTPAGARGDEVAMLQYTSGATADPKGVMVTHANLLHNQRMMQFAFGHTRDDDYAAGVCWLPPYHDMGLMGHVLHAVYIGFPCYLLPPLGILHRPARWLAALDRYRANASGGPNFAYDLCVSRIAPDDCRQFDLSHWDVAGIGAEPVRAETLERFCERFEPQGFRRQAFYPSYGLAEATLFVTGGAHDAPPVVKEESAPPVPQREHAAHSPAARRRVGCGRPWLDQVVKIVDPDTRLPCPAGQTGEIWVSGPSVAAGYWGREAESAAVFRAALSSHDPPPDGQAEACPATFLRTGDLGYVEGGDLFVAGRLKDLIIVRGRNYHPQEIEQTVQSVDPALRADGGAAFSVDVDGEERIVVIQEVDRRARDFDPAKLTRDIRREVSRRHELRLHEIVFLRGGTLPKTTSGKVQRYACRQRYLEGRLQEWSLRSVRN